MSSARPSFRFRAGEVVDVYEDPITREKREGAARIRGYIEHVGDFDGYALHRYRVCFIGTTEVVERAVLSREVAS